MKECISKKVRNTFGMARKQIGRTSFIYDTLSKQCQIQLIYKNNDAIFSKYIGYVILAQ